MKPTYKQGLAAAAAVLGLLVAGPAIGAAGSDGRGGQPSASAKGVVATSHFAPVPRQPAANTPGQVAKAHFAPVPKQPVNRSPQKSGGFKAGKQLRHSKHDQGVKGLRPTKDRGKKNLPVQKG